MVAFQTSSGTATKTFSVKVENHQSAANSDILIKRGLPTRTPAIPIPESLVILQELTTSMAEKITESPLPATIGLTMIPVPIRTPSQQSAPGYGFYIIAVIAGLLVWARKKFFR